MTKQGFRHWFRQWAVMAVFAFLGLTTAHCITSAQAQTLSTAIRWENNAGTGETPQQFAGSNPCVVSIFRWEPNEQRWLRWYNGVPDYVNELNALTFLNVHYGYWFAFDAQCLAERN